MVAGLLTMEPGQRVPKEGFSAHEGTEFSIVLSGEVTLGTEDGERVIKEGSVTFIPKNTLHYSENRGAEQARIVWVIAPQIKLEV
jgi:quercetin dioxygenase-like cupin family protein